MSLLEVESVSRSFGGITALHDVSLAVEAGEAVGLVGPNGAGKTTLFDCLTGVQRPDRGRVVLDGVDVTGVAVNRRARMGIGRTFQRLELFSGMTVGDHLLMAVRGARGSGSLWRDLLNRSAPTAEEERLTATVLLRLGLDRMADTPVDALTLGQGRLVELGRALATEPRLLLLDEPSSGLDRVEAFALGEVLDTVRREHGTAMLLVEHDLDLVVQTVHRVVVLDHGEVLAGGPTAEVMAHPAVRHAYLGEGT